MTLSEALAIAAQAKPKHQHRQLLDKLQGSSTSEHALSLQKLAETTSSLQKRLDQIAADVEFLSNTPGSFSRRTLQ